MMKEKRPSLSLTITLPVRPSVTTTLARPLPMSLPSTLPTKFRPLALQQGIRLADQRAALVFFFAVGDDADLRLLEAEHQAGVGAAHVRKLDQVLGLAVCVGADVDDEARDGRRRDRCCRAPAARRP